MGRMYLQIVRHVEATEHKKFKKIPKLRYVQRVGSTVARNVTTYEVYRNKETGQKRMGRVKKAEVKLTSNFASSYQRPFIASVIAHELRENLRTQHGAGMPYKGKQSGGRIHRAVERAGWYRKDENWAKRKFGYALGDR